MKIFTKIVANVIFFLNFSLATTYAHETGEAHTEVPASIDPVVAVVVVAAIAVGGFLIWKFLLKSKEKPPTKPTFPT